MKFVRLARTLVCQVCAKAEKTRGAPRGSAGKWRIKLASRKKTKRAVQMCDLKDGEFLDYFRDGVNGLGVGQQAVGDGRDDVKGTFQELPGVRSIQLPGAEDAIDAIPGETQRGLHARPTRGHVCTQGETTAAMFFYSCLASLFRNNHRNCTS